MLAVIQCKIWLEFKIYVIVVLPVASVVVKLGISYERKNSYPVSSMSTCPGHKAAGISICQFTSIWYQG